MEWYPEDTDISTKYTSRVTQDDSQLDAESVNLFAKNTAPKSGSAASPGSGRTPGMLSVSMTGAATYRIPIALPPGINGVIPKLALSYNSQSGDGLAGYGWSVEGLSSINRIPSTIYHDNKSALVNFTDTDRYALDGQRLLLKSGTYHKPGAIYQTENYSNIKITSFGNAPFDNEDIPGPKRFNIFYPDGSKAEYGGADFNTGKLEYGLAKFWNPQGIPIIYRYDTSQGVLRIDRIYYGGTSQSYELGDHFTEIKFVYSDKTRPEHSYVKGQRFSRTHILKEIQVWTAGKKYRSYKLSHDTTLLGYQRLISFQEFSDHDKISREPIHFNYPKQTQEKPIHKLITSNLAISQIDNRNAQVIPIDFQGSGQMDFIITPKTGDKKKFWLFRGNNFRFPEQRESKYPIEAIIPIRFKDHKNWIAPGQGFTKITYDDQLKAHFDVYGYGGAVQPLHLKYKKSWQMPTYVSDVSKNDIFCGVLQNQKLAIPHQYLSGDFNGNGLTEIIALSKPYTIFDCPDYNGCKCPSTIVSDNSKATLIDMDSKQSQNYIRTIGELQQPIGLKDKLQAMDVNGDGKTDIVHIQEGKLTVYSIGKLFVFDELLLPIMEIENPAIKLDLPIYFGDYNGDGKTDFITPEKTNATYYYHTFVATSETIQYRGLQSMPFYYQQSYWDGREGILRDYRLIPVDFNGDGKTDIVKYYARTKNNTNDGYQKLEVFHNIAGENSAPFKKQWDFKSQGKKDYTGGVNHYPLLAFVPSEQPNYGLSIAAFSNKWIHSFTSHIDHTTQTSLSAVSHKGVTHHISYQGMVDRGFNPNPHVMSAYRHGYAQRYPFVDITSAPSMRLVSKLERTIADTPTQTKDFYYGHAVSHLRGLGFRGF